MPRDFDLKQSPELAALVHEARGVIARGAPMACLADHVRRVLASGELRTAVRDAVVSLLELPSANPVVMQQDNVVFHNEPGGLLVSLSTSGFDATAPIYSTCVAGIFGVAGGSGLSLYRYTLSPGFDADVWDPCIRIESRESVHVARGEVFVSSRGSAFEYASSSGLVLKVIDQRHSDSMLWEFDRATGAALHAYASDVASTTLRYIMRFVAEYGDASSGEAVQCLLEHPYHFVRWEAVKALARLDPTRFASAVRRLVDDPHAHVRAAAARTLQQLERPLAAEA